MLRTPNDLSISLYINSPAFKPFLLLYVVPIQTLAKREVRGSRISTHKTLFIILVSPICLLNIRFWISLAMASSEQQAPTIATPAPNLVGNAFVDQYYHMLHERPEHVHRFYQDISKLGRPERNGTMGITTTMHAINEKILSLGFGDFGAQIVSVDAQESFGGGVILLVTGFMIGKDDMKQKFTQCFFLAPQDKGYYVLNDIFRFVEEDGTQMPVDVEAPVIFDQVYSSTLEINVTDKLTAAAGVVNTEEVHNLENGLDSSEDEDEEEEEEEEAPVPEVVDEIPDDSNMVSESLSTIEDVPKKSYASIVKVTKEDATPPSTVTANVRSAPKIQDQQGTATQPPQETTDSSANVHENEVNQEAEAEGYSIYIRGLPANATLDVLENEFKKFGPIKSDGIQVRTQRGFSFGFVEFEVASAVQKAIEASPVVIRGRNVYVEEKKSTNRGNSRGRFSSGRGTAAAYRNEGPRGRENSGNVRGYDRAGSNGRGDYGYRNGNRSGFPNRGSNGNQRNDQMGSNGGHTIRNSGLAVYAAAKVVAAGLSASA